MSTRCTYLEAGPAGVVCGASVTGITPGLYERTAYCDTEDHYRCPLLVARTLRGGAPEVATRAVEYTSR